MQNTEVWETHTCLLLLTKHGCVTHINKQTGNIWCRHTMLIMMLIRKSTFNNVGLFRWLRWINCVQRCPPFKMGWKHRKLEGQLWEHRPPNNRQTNQVKNITFLAEKTLNIWKNTQTSQYQSINWELSECVPTHAQYEQAFLSSLHVDRQWCSVTHTHIHTRRGADGVKLRCLGSFFESRQCW